MSPDQSPAQHNCTVVTGKCWQDIIWSVFSTESLALILRAQFPQVKPLVFRSCPSIWRMNLFVKDLNCALRRSGQRDTSAGSGRSRRRRPVKTGSVRWWSLNVAETEPKLLLIFKWVIKFVMICMLFFFLFLSFWSREDAEGTGGGHPEHYIYVWESKPGAGGLRQFDQPGFITEGKCESPSVLKNTNATSIPFFLYIHNRSSYKG